MGAIVVPHNNIFVPPKQYLNRTLHALHNNAINQGLHFLYTYIFIILFIV